MAFLRSLVTTTATITAIAAFPLSSSSSPSSYSQLPQHTPKTQKNSSFSSSSHVLLSPNCLGLVNHFTHPPSALHMDAPTSDHKPTPQEDMGLPELLTEFMVDMKCEGCVNAVKNKIQTVNGVKNVDVDLSNQVVRILGSSSLKTMTEALKQTGRKARLIGQGVPEDFLVSAAVAEFKGPDIFGVVRLAQVSIELARIEASFSGLSPGKHGWSINEFGDLTKGAASTGKVFSTMNQGTDGEQLGDLGTLDVSENGEAYFSNVKKKLRVRDLIGRSIVVYETEDKSDPGVTGAVIARSAGVGENYKKICTCDGTTIWESSDTDFVHSKV
ncbi:Sod_Cu domain-containing protein/HMA domain-containing protein [Cephalotus follicularis]|uniref:Superoxide dismutase copper chaperone n=1 Tax=Cephalotus follicularis TaxID=3775 RepID=A0A1Q3CH70_CEPFO|nr:Sod_Cu domain-containing protein/HMA domain-containing protein [Cephalotus follicularis]